MEASRMEDAERPGELGTGFSPAQVAFAAQAWPMRAEEEDRSQAVFEELARLAPEAGLTSDQRARLEAAAQDEARHSRLCTEVGAALGARPPVLDRSRVAQRLGALPAAPMLRFLALISVEVAMGETLSCAFFRAGMERATEPQTRQALTSILRDEAIHARLGWGLLSLLRPRLGEAELAFLREEVRVQLGALEQLEAVPSLRRLERGEPFDPALPGLGVLDPEVRVAAFYGALERRVLPRLDRLGLDGARAWEQRYRPG
jgi:hypothetical protein